VPQFEKNEKKRQEICSGQLSELTREFIPKTAVLKGNDAELITEKDKIFERCKEYTAELYKTNEQPEDIRERGMHSGE
jgi:hypothetical protein